MFRLKSQFIFFTILICWGCKNNSSPASTKPGIKGKPDIMITTDCSYTFDEAIAGSKAPQSVINQLQLINVRYYSTDHKIHQGQLLTNKKIANDLQHIFTYMLRLHFTIATVIPIVKFGWNDNQSMANNNTYSFCYRDISYSKHATGMAIDINPYFNPERWKDSLSYRRSKPPGATYHRNVPGTFYASHPVVLEFKKFGFKWGHDFSMKWDDHHFEK